MRTALMICAGLVGTACALLPAQPEHRQGILVDVDQDGQAEVVVAHVAPSGHALSLWRSDREGPVWRTPVAGAPHQPQVAIVLDGVLLVTTSGTDEPTLHALDAERGTLLWSRTDPGRVPVPFVMDDVALVKWSGVAGLSSRTERVQPRTGHEDWSLPCSVRRTPDGPLCSAETRQLMAVDLATGKATPVEGMFPMHVGVEGVVIRRGTTLDRVDPADGTALARAPTAAGEVLALAPDHVVLEDRTADTTHLRGTPWEGQGAPWHTEVTGHVARLTPLTAGSEAPLPRHVPLQLSDDKAPRGVILDTRTGRTSDPVDDPVVAHRCGEDWLLSTMWWVSHIDGASGRWGERTSGRLAGPCVGGQALVADHDPATGADVLTVVDATDLSPVWTVGSVR